MQKPQRLLLLVVFPLLVCAACSNSPQPQASAAPSAVLTEFASPIPTLPAETATASEFELPTPTPFIYTIQANDTLVGLAERFGVSLDAILAANPGVDARFLSVGLEILIPAGDEQFLDGEIVATPTPLPLDTGDVRCYPSAANELTCLLLVNNSSGAAVENLAGLVQLYDEQGALVTSNAAVAALNLLPVDGRLPLVAYWPQQPEGWQRAVGLLTMAFPSTGDEERYLDVELLNAETQIAADGLSAFVEGALEITTGQESSSLWILAVAFDADGEVVGYRRWEGAGDEADFEITVYSLGPQIESVELYAEARP